MAIDFHVSTQSGEESKSNRKHVTMVG